jgi:hypothetical protein
MDMQNAALAAAGVIGSSVAVLHGVSIQRHMIGPLAPVMHATDRISSSGRRLVPLLLHFSTFNWFLGGLALIAAANWFGSEARLATGLLVGSSYLFGALGNFWGTKGRHPGWALYAVVLGLIMFGLN